MTSLGCCFCGRSGGREDCCRRCGLWNEDAPFGVYWRAVTRVCVARLFARGAFVLTRDMTRMRLERLFEQAAREEDAAHLHATLFEQEDVVDLEIGIEALGELVRAVRVELDAPATKVHLPRLDRVVDAPPGWTPRAAVGDVGPERWHPSGRFFAATLEGDRPQAAVWSTDSGAVHAAPHGATDIAFSSDGETMFVAYDHWLELREFGSLAVLSRLPLGGNDGAAFRIVLSPRGRWLAVTWRAWAGDHGGTHFIDLSSGPRAPELQKGGPTHQFSSGDVVFSDDEELYAYSGIDPKWVEKPTTEQIDYGGLAVGKMNGPGATIWALWGAPPAVKLEPEVALRVPPPVFVADRHVEQRLPTGEVFRVSYASVCRTFAPNPREFPEVVKQRVKVRERSAAERAVTESTWAPCEPFVAEWIEEDRVVLVVTRAAITRHRWPGGEVVGRGAAWLFDGWPFELLIDERRETAAVLWARAAAFSTGYEIFDLRCADPTQRLGIGARFVHWMRRMQPMLIGPAAFGPGSLFAVTVVEGGFWYDPTRDGVGEGLHRGGTAYVHDLSTPTYQRLHLMPKTALPRDHDAQADPDRPRSLRFVSDRAIEVEISHGDRIELAWEELSPRGRDDRYPCRIGALEPVSPRWEAAPVHVKGRGRLDALFAAPSVAGQIEAARFDVHPSAAFVILELVAVPAGAPSTGVFDATTGALVFTRDGAIAMAWATGAPARLSQSNASVAVLFDRTLTVYSMPAKEEASWPLDLPGRARDLFVGAPERRAIVTWSDAETSHAGFVALRIGTGQSEGSGVASIETDGICAGAFSPDGATWVGFAPALAGTGRLGALLVHDFETATCVVHVFELDEGEVLPDPTNVTVDFAAEDQIVLRVPGGRTRLVNRS